MIKRIINFVKYDIWRVRVRDLNRTKSFLIKQLRVILLTFRGFDEDQCQLRASALTFYSLLSIVPVLALVFGIAKGFGFDQMLREQLLERFPTQQDVLVRIFDFAHTMLENTRGGLMAGVGVALLFWAVIKVLGNIEKSFNYIWGVKKQRPLGRRFSDYLSIMLICPILIIFSSSATVFVTTQIRQIFTKVEILEMIAPVVLPLLNILPYCIIWLVFSFIYVFMPNSKVNLKSGIIAGILAGTVYQLVQWGYVNFQVGVSRFNAIYGSFAALPLFLVWLQISWIIVLFGAEISFAHQNVDTYEFEPDCLNISYSFKRLLVLGVMNRIAVNFAKCKPPITVEKMSQILDVPVRLVRQIIFELKESRLIAEVKTEEYKEFAYQPACDINRLTIKQVIDSLENRGSDIIPVADTKSINTIRKSLESLSQRTSQAPENQLLKDV